MTVQELYDWCKQNDLTDAKIEIVGDRAVYDEITERNIVEYGESVSPQGHEKYIVIEVKNKMVGEIKVNVIRSKERYFKSC